MPSGCRRAALSAWWNDGDIGFRADLMEFAMSLPILDAEIASVIRKNLEEGRFGPTGAPNSGFTLAKLGQLREAVNSLDPQDEALRRDGLLSVEERLIP
jgi:hypothetical protein